MRVAGVLLLLVGLLPGPCITVYAIYGSYLRYAVNDVEPDPERMAELVQWALRITVAGLPVAGVGLFLLVMGIRRRRRERQRQRQREEFD